MSEIRYALDRSRNIATLTIDTPGPVNTIGGGFLTALEEALSRARQDQVAGILLTSGKPRSFLDGANLAELRKNLTEGVVRSLLARLRSAMHDLASMPAQVVGLLHGQTALGGGFELLLYACDHVFCTSDSRMGLPEVNVGLIPGGGGTWTLRRAMGLRDAADIILGGKVLPPDLYVKHGLLTVAPGRELPALAAAWIADHQGRPNRNLDPGHAEPDPLPAEQATKLFASLRRRHCTCPERPYLAAAVDAIEFGAGHGLRESLEREADLFVPLMFHPNSRNKIDLFFTTTAAGPRLVPTNPKNVRPVPRIAVLGAGLMGQGIAQITADAGTPVLLVDIERRFVDGAIDSITRSLDGLVAKGRWEEKRRAAVIAAIEGTTDYSRLAEVPLVIEAVPEDMEVKRRVLSQVQAVNPGIIFASNTSAIPMEDIAEGSVRPEMVVGMHYFSPVPLMALLEVVRGPGSSAEAVDTAVALGRRQKKTCVLVKSSPGFYTSRLFGQFVCMGFRLAELGADPFVVDSLAVEAGFPRGPLHMFGSVGGMVVYHAGRFMQERFPGRHPLPASLEKVALAGYTGAGRRSFYLDERGLEPDRSVLDHLVRTPGLPVPDAREIKDMLLLGMVSEAFACLSEGVIDDFVTMDLAAVLGVGFPDCWHGPARFVSSAGVSRVVARLEALGQKFGIPALVPSRDLRTLVARGIEHGLA